MCFRSSLSWSSLGDSFLNAGQALNINLPNCLTVTFACKQIYSGACDAFNVEMGMPDGFSFSFFAFIYLFIF